VSTFTIRFRRGSASQWSTANPTLASGEPALETDTGVFKIGDGSSDYASLAAIGGGGGVSDGDKGDITVSASGATWTIDANAVTNAKLADMAGHTVKVRDGGSSGDPSDLVMGSHSALIRNGGNIIATDAAIDTVLRRNSGNTLEFGKVGTNHLESTLAAEIAANTAKVTNATHTGDVTGATALTIANDAVTYAKMQNVSAASRLIGRGSAGGAGDPEEITLGAGLSMTGTVLAATAGGTNRYAASMMRPAAGEFIGNGLNATALGTQIQVANRTVLAPWVPGYDVTIDQLGVSVSTGVAATNVKAIIYASDANGRPDAVIIETANISSAANATVMSTIASTALTAGTTYWVGIRSSGTATVRTLGVGSAPAVTYTTAATPLIESALVKTETFANAAAAWGYVASQHSNALIPLVLMRVA
jgi:hypothetical protein